MFNFVKNGKGELLSFFFKDPDKEYYLTEIARNLNKEASYFQRHLDGFVKDGILLDERKGNLRFFKLNKNYPLYEDIKKIISKTIGIEFKLKELVGVLNGVEIAFIFGSIAKNKENTNSDIDLMLIGEVDQDELIKKVVELETKLNREINYHIYRKQEFIKNIKENNSFIINIISEPIITLKGNPDEFTRLIKK
ncbi:MAG: nucleotidyltransferase domain-containing protein [Patescibacteria group bacterium]|nr:nucleotidyltransferase domain-containing protein [Patescibacteria group bacterium]